MVHEMMAVEDPAIREAGQGGVGKEASVGVRDRLSNAGEKIRGTWYRSTAFRVVWLIGFGFFAAVETHPIWSAIWWFFTGVFVGQEFPDRRAWSKRKRE